MRTKRTDVPPDEPILPPDEPVLATLGPDSTLAERRSEAMLGDREFHPLISGLTERLEEAGADPEDVIDDDAVLAELARLQNIAATPAPHWWRHRR